VDNARRRIDRSQVRQERVKIEVEVGQQVDLVHHHHLGSPEHHGVLERLFLSFRDGVDHGLGVLPHPELRRADEVAHILDDEEVEVAEREPAHTGANHHRIEVALAAKSGAGIHDRDGRGSRSLELVGIEGGGDVTLEDADAQRASERVQRALEQRRLARTRCGHQVHGTHTRLRERVAVGVGHTVVLGEQVLQNFDPYRPRIGIAGVIADLASGAVVVVGPVVVVVVGPGVVVVQMFRAVGMQMNSAHRYASTSASSMDTMRNSSPLSSVTSKLPQVPHPRIGMSSVVTARHSRHSTVAGVCSITSSHPLRSVGSVKSSHPKRKASGTTWRR
jgi:uncharacterized membrane protein (Fun14 family)